MNNKCPIVSFHNTSNSIIIDTDWTFEFLAKVRINVPSDTILNLLHYFQPKIIFELAISFGTFGEIKIIWEYVWNHVTSKSISVLYCNLHKLGFTNKHYYLMFYFRLKLYRIITCSNTEHVLLHQWCRRTCIVTPVRPENMYCYTSHTGGRSGTADKTVASWLTKQLSVSNNGFVFTSFG